MSEPDELFTEDYVGPLADYGYLTSRVSTSGTHTILHDHSKDEDCGNGECEHWYVPDDDSDL